MSLALPLRLHAQTNGKWRLHWAHLAKWERWSRQETPAQYLSNRHLSESHRDLEQMGRGSLSWMPVFWIARDHVKTKMFCCFNKCDYFLINSIHIESEMLWPHRCDIDKQKSIFSFPQWKVKSWFGASFIPSPSFLCVLDPICMRIYRGLVGIHKHCHLHSIPNRVSLKSNARSLWILLVAFRWTLMLTQSRTSLAFCNKMHSDRNQHETTIMGILFLWKDLPHGTDIHLSCCLRMQRESQPLSFSYLAFISFVDLVCLFTITFLATDLLYV